MVSKMAKDTVAKWEKEGLRPSFDDIVRLNALGLRVERGPNSADFAALPRVAFLGDLVLVEPTVRRWMWIDAARQIVQDADLIVFAYALAVNEPVKLTSRSKLEKALDERLAKAREEAARLEENAQRARGKSFNEWDRGEKRRARDEEREAKKQAGFLDRAAREQAAIGQRIFDRHGRLRKGANKADIERWKKLNEFQLNNDPKNNPAIKEAERLEKERRDLEAKTQRDVADIKAALNGAMTP